MTKKIDSNKWRDILSHINDEVTSISYKTWFEPLVPLYIDDEKGIFYVAATDSFKVNVIKQNERYIETFENSIEKVYTKNYKVHVSHKNEDEIAIITEADEEKPKNQAAVSIDHDSPYRKEFYLNPKLRFDNFVVGANNNYAHAVSLAVAEDPANLYNPLFIYGGSGLGKTHLMNAIGHHIIERNPSMKVLYVSSEMFTSELLKAIRDRNANSKMDSFKQKYRSVDVLLIDDIQFIEGKEATQNEFFHTFNTLHDMKKQIVISSDRHPSKLKDLDDRLRSRFQWNVVADIQPPDYETRVAILRNKAEQENIELDDDLLDVINLIAEKVKFNIRELESALTRIISFSHVFHKKITVKFAKESLSDIFTSTDNTISCETIKKAVCKKYGIKLMEIESSQRKREIAHPRQIAMYLCRELTDLSLPKIGKSFGGRDHTTVLHAHEKISKEIKSNEALAEEIRSLKDDIQ
ncbi:MAG: chromosomal replication initiator protein DnaA [Firmicutes bacterium]|nr:chromosomal replication initiator protein DnaA [Bacillota bacterium]